MMENSILMESIPKNDILVKMSSAKVINGFLNDVEPVIYKNLGPFMLDNIKDYGPMISSNDSIRFPAEIPGFLKIYNKSFILEITREYFNEFSEKMTLYFYTNENLSISISFIIMIFYYCFISICII